MVKLNTNMRSTLTENRPSARAQLSASTLAPKHTILKPGKSKPACSCQVNALQELESFSYAISHDLRAPVRHISGFVEMLERNAARELSKENLGLLKVLSDSSKALARMLDGLLAYSRAGRVEFAPSAVDLNALVRHLSQSSQLEHRDRKISWAVKPLGSIKADPESIRQIFAQLICNAVKFTRRQAKAHIEIGRQQLPGESVFYVRDNGAGFNPAYAHKLFGVFQRLHTAAEFDGVGIGLACVHRLVARHGGRTWAEGAEGAGATFYFSIGG